MKYPNASKGVNKIYMSNIVALAASVIMAICYVILTLCMENSDKSNNDVLVLITTIVMICTLGIYILSYIIQIFGINQATKDEPAFRVSLIAIIASIVLTVLQAIFFENEFISFIVEIGMDVAKFFLVHYIIHGIMHLSEHLGRTDMIKKGKGIFIVIYTAIGFEIVVRVCEIIFGKEVGEQLSMPFAIAASILSVVEYFMFLIYTAKGNKMLKEN